MQKSSFLGKRGKIVWKMRFSGLSSKTVHEIFPKLGMKLEFNIRNILMYLNLLQKIWFLGKRGKSAKNQVKMRFSWFFSKTSHEIFPKLGIMSGVNSRNNLIQPYFMGKFFFWGKRGKIVWKMSFSGHFSKTIHEIFPKLYLY